MFANVLNAHGATILFHLNLLAECEVDDIPLNFCITSLNMKNIDTENVTYATHKNVNKTNDNDEQQKISVSIPWNMKLL